MAIAVEDALAEVDFSPESYRDHAAAVPSMDGFKAAKLELRFGGSGFLDRTSGDDIALLEAARLGEEVLLLVRGEFVGKGFRLNRKSNGEGEMSYACTVRIISVEAGEAAGGDHGS